MNRLQTILILSFLIIIPLQLLFFNRFVFFDIGFCFLYLLLLLVIPPKVRPIGTMCMGLLVGLIIDVFSQTLGIHAMSATLFTLIRYYWLKIYFFQNVYETNSLILIKSHGLMRFIAYSFPLVFIYCFCFFFVESGTIHLFNLTILKSISTTFISLAFIIIAQYFFYANP